MQSHVESYLLLVALAEQCILGTTFDEESAQTLRMRYLRALVGRHRSEIILERLGIQRQRVPCPKSIAAEEICEFPFSNMKQLEDSMESLEPRKLRILQCVQEIGSVHILEAIQTAAAEPINSIGQYGKSVNGLPQIHHYLDTQRATSHLDIARTRYLKLCYYQTYIAEVEILQEKKRRRRIESKRVTNQRKTATYHKGLSAPIDTPATDWINRTYPESGNSTAESIVKQCVVRGIQKTYGGSPEAIQENLSRYINDGRTFGLMFHGMIDPALLILFPGMEQHEPSLSLEKVDLPEKDRRKLRKPIQLKE